MALIPEMNFEIDLNSSIQPTKTYKVLWDSNSIQGYTEELESISQFIQKALSTERNKYPIYTDSFGVEFSQLRESNLPDSVLAIEIPRLITEAIKYDDRITQVSNFKVDFESTAIKIYFEVSSIYGNIAINETF